MTVAGLASRGARVYMGARSAEKAEKAITDLKRELGPQADIVFLKLDLTDFKSVVEAARELRRYVFKVPIDSSGYDLWKRQTY